MSIENNVRKGYSFIIKMLWNIRKKTEGTLLKESSSWVLMLRPHFLHIKTGLLFKNERITIIMKGETK
jgi:predicted membrane-bound dolichyl-phosphate-mannose-protein mannosyltransferase